jgi:nitroimidazol reductase NimA-like FMN-containing flavoprotein (pyridoxamine 5'-phosphate oxidase superfamily)
MSALITPAARQVRTGTVSAVSHPDAHSQGHDQKWPSPPNPGDLSRRIAHRRAELRLSQLQVAARARITPRYMEYLERYPARPSGPTLRRLAAALLTTPAALLGAGPQPPAGCHPGRPAGEADDVNTVRLTPGECQQLIAPGGVGRLAFTMPSGPVVLPVSFVVVADTIVIRTRKGTLIQAHADDQVAFEADHIDEAMRQGWSVLVSGQAHPVRPPSELRHLRETAALWPWPGGEHDSYVRIVPARITGRRIEAQ